MYKQIIEKLKDKNIAILGFGKEGKSTYNFIRRHLKQQHLTIIDKNNITISDEYVTVITGEDYLTNLEKYDLIIKSPGISLKDENISPYQSKLTSQLELILEINRNNIIGITGTKGKSTTATLLYEVIKKQNNNVYLLGNIGNPIFDEIENYNSKTILVIEMSSHQLEYIKFSPHIAAILNLYTDHLDHDGNITHYHDNKMNIFKYQTANDYYLYSDDNKYLYERIKNNNYKGIPYSIRFDDKNKKENSLWIKNKRIYLNEELLYEDKERLLLGDHNLKNIMFILAIIKILNLDLSLATKTIQEFKGLKYRMEYIGTYNDISYYNDTIATIPEATKNSINTIGNVDTLIFGGLDRGIDYQEFTEFLKKSTITNFICMPTTGTIIGKKLEKEPRKNVYFIDSLEEACEIANKVTNKHHSCLLSPAAASYEYFKNFEEKGKKFENIVKKKDL